MNGATTETFRRLDRLPQAAAYVDRAGSIRSANLAFRHVWAKYGADMDSLDGANLLTLIDQDHREMVTAILAVPRVLPQSFGRQVRLAGGTGLVVDFMPIRRRAEACTTWLVTVRAENTWDRRADLRPTLRAVPRPGREEQATA